jgi:hypothetical protein
MVVVARPSTSKSYTSGYVPRSRTNVLGSTGNTPVHPAASLRPISGRASMEPVASFGSISRAVPAPPHQANVQVEPPIASLLLPPAPRTPPAPKLSTLPPSGRGPAAINYALKFLARYKVSTAALLLSIFTGCKDDRMSERRENFFRNDTALETILSRFQEYAPDRIRDWAVAQSVPLVEEKVSKEIHQLKKEWKLGIKDVSASFISGGLNLNGFQSTIEQSAPTVWRLITACAQTSRASQENSLKHPEKVHSSLVGLEYYFN